jgi:hypothetical protein
MQAGYTQWKAWMAKYAKEILEQPREASKRNSIPQVPKTREANARRWTWPAFAKS